MIFIQNKFRALLTNPTTVAPLCTCVRVRGLFVYLVRLGGAWCCTSDMLRGGEGGRERLCSVFL